jgi:cyclase
MHISTDLYNLLILLVSINILKKYLMVPINDEIMQRERITESVYIFRSDLYVQVTAGVIVTSEGAVLFDTLLYPEETLQMKRFVEERLGMPVTYVINSHHHADHTTGTCFFPDATIVSHRLCRQLLDTRGRQSLEQVKSLSNDMDSVSIVLPDVVFEDQLQLKVGDKTLTLRSAPGHSHDLIMCVVEDEQVLFASDAVMSIPYFVDGDYHACLQTLQLLKDAKYENIIQGHGEVILRGEIHAHLQNDIDYLDFLYQAVVDALAQPSDKIESALNAIDVEACGKRRILLNGVVQQLHQSNVRALAKYQRQMLSDSKQSL